MLREITIKPALNGYIVGVGCQHLVYINPGDLLQDLGDYLASPKSVEARIRKTCFNLGKLDMCEPPEEATNAAEDPTPTIR